MRDRYTSDATATMSPAQMVVALYDALALDLVRAEQALTTNDLGTVNDSLVHAEEIVIELRAGLDSRSEWEGAEGLHRIYGFLFETLVDANLGKDPQRVRSCRRLVEPLRDAWKQAATSLVAS